MASKVPDDEFGLGDNPLDDDPLAEALYGRSRGGRPSPATASSPGAASPAAPGTPSATGARTGRKRSKGRQPLRDGQTFRLVTFSFYEDDVARLDELLAEARKLGHRRANRSQIVRLALRQVDLTGLPDDV